QENIETASTATSIIPASTANSDYNDSVIIAQKNQPEPISSELINLDIRNTLQKAMNLANRTSYNPSRNSQKGYRHDSGRSQSVTDGQGSVNGSQTDRLCHYEADYTVLPSKRAETATRSLSGHIKSQPEGLQQCIAAQIVPDPCIPVEKLHEFLPDCEKIPEPSKNFQVTQWMASIDGKEKHSSFNSRMEEKQPSTTQESAKNSPSSQQQKFQCEKAATISEQGQRQGTSQKTLLPGLQNPKDSAGCHGKCISDGQKNDGIAEKGGSQIEISEIISDILDGIPNLYIAINDMKSHNSDKNSSICNNLKTNNLNKYSKFNIEFIIETRIEEAINIIKEDNKKFPYDILNSFTEVKTYTISLKKCFDTSQQEVSKLTLKLNQATSDNTRQTELWQELTHKEDMYKIEVINLIYSFQHEIRNSQRCNNSEITDLEQLLHTLPRISTPLNQNEGARILNQQVLDVENSQLKAEFSTSFHNLEPSMGQALLKEVPKLKEWMHFSGEGEYDHMGFISGIEMIKEYFELPDKFVKVRFNTLFTRSAHREYIKLRQAHGHQSWTWWKTQIINKWANDAWRFKVETAF
ncbi:hypothetical protein O181_055764, partial [Austropuccinia psidii MF-1]|nr:hypothetical protein [Austropuccinia psidii MF-1]